MGWNQGDGKGIRNRFYLAENLTNPRFKDLRLLTYNYHRKGMDQFAANPEQARKSITENIKNSKKPSRYFKTAYCKNPSSLPNGLS